MSVDPNEIVLMLQTVRLPSGSDQFVVPQGCDVTRSELRDLLGRSAVDAEQSVIQPGTGREGTERLVALQTDSLSESAKSDLRKSLARWLCDVPSIIDEVAQGTLSADGELPNCRQLTDWQTEVNQRYGSAGLSGSESPKSTKHKSSSGGLVMLGVGLLIAASFVLLPQIFQGKNKREALEKKEKANQTSAISYEGWNLTGSKSLVGEARLLQWLAPLVTQQPASPDGNRASSRSLARVLDEINHLRLAQPFKEGGGDVSSKDGSLRRLLADDALKSYVRKLVRADGASDRFGLVTDHVHLASLRAILPKSVDDRTAIEFRRLAHQLIGETTIGDSGKRITVFDKPFFNLADKDAQLRSFDVMADKVPNEFRRIRSQCTFFTPDDCGAAKEIVLYFHDIGFFANGKLGFPADDNRHETLEVNADSSKSSSHQFARLLLEWQAFATAELHEPQSAQGATKKTAVTDTP